MYNKEVQTTDYDEDEDQPSVDQLRKQISKEYEHLQQAQREKELEEESAQLDREIEEEIRG